jgi:hypothetical protein
MTSTDDTAAAPGLDLTLIDFIAKRVLELLGDRNGNEIQLLTVRRSHVASRCIRAGSTPTPDG